MRGLGTAVLACAVLNGTARGEGLSLRLQPGFSSTSTTSTDALGTTASDGIQFAERYRLIFDKQPYGNVRLSLGGNYDRIRSWTDTDGVASEGVLRDWTGFGDLGFGNQLLGGALSYTRAQSSGESSTGGVTTESQRVIRESFGGSATWRPVNLPSLALVLRRSQNHDSARETQDTVNDEASLTSTYAPRRDLELRASTRYSRNEDRLTGTESSRWEEAAQGSWSARLLQGRTNANVTYRVGHQSTDVEARPGGVVRTPRAPTRTLALVEGVGDAPESDTLVPNDRLSDSQLDVPVDVNSLNLGFSRSLANDTALRDLGAEFADTAVAVNTVGVYVAAEAPLPPGIAAAITWSAYESTDNRTWTALAITRPVEFREIEQRFEITIASTQARFVKVVTRPLPASFSIQGREFADIRVTEMEFAFEVPAESVPATTDSTDGALSASARTILLRSRPLSHDISLFVAHGSDRATTWSLVNGLSYSQPLRRDLVLGARAERRDEDPGQGHTYAHRGTLSLGYDPIPTYAAVLTYSGQIATTTAGTTTSNGVSFLNRADLYTGIAASAGASASVNSLETGRDATNMTASTSLTVTPNQVVTTTFAYQLAWSRSSGGETEAATTRSSRIEGGLSLSPIPALFASGTVSRQTSNIGAATLANVVASFSPFQGGTLLMRYAHSESYDTSGDTRTRATGPSLRWTLRPGLFLDGAYNWTTIRSDQLNTKSEGVFVNLYATIL